MLRTYVTHASVLGFEPTLADYLRNDEDDHSVTIAKAKVILTQDLRSNQLELKKLCTPLILQVSVPQTTTKTGSKSTEDFKERQFWVVDVTAQTGANQVFTLQGTNDDASEVWTTCATLSMIDIGTITITFDNVFKFYRLNWTGTTCTYSSELVEESFHLAHVFKALEMIYTKYQAQVTDLWEAKRDFYSDAYNTSMKNIIFSYDNNLDGVISSGEDSKQMRAGFTR